MQAPPLAPALLLLQNTESQVAGRFNPLLFIGNLPYKLGQNKEILELLNSITTGDNGSGLVSLFRMRKTSASTRNPTKAA